MHLRTRSHGPPDNDQPPDPQALQAADTGTPPANALAPEGLPAAEGAPPLEDPLAPPAAAPTDDVATPPPETDPQAQEPDDDPESPDATQPRRLFNVEFENVLSPRRITRRAPGSGPDTPGTNTPPAQPTQPGTNNPPAQPTTPPGAVPPPPGPIPQPLPGNPPPPPPPPPPPLPAAVVPNPAMATTWHDYLTATCQFDDAVATRIEGLGITSPGATAAYDKDRIEELCKGLRKKQIGQDPAAAGYRAEVEVLEPSIHMLTVTYYTVRARAFCSRTTVVADLTTAELERWYRWKKTADKYDDTTSKTPDPKDFPANWPKAFESIQNWLGTKLGDETQVPLTYITRDNADPPPSVDDPSSNYKGNPEEFTARMPHNVTTAQGRIIKAPWYDEDNAKVWQLLTSVFQPTTHWVYMQPYLKALDGRGAYLRLYQQYLGPNNAENMASKADADIEKIRYTGEKRRFTFNDYVDQHTRYHNILNDLKAYGHEGINEGTKVRKFLRGIHSPPMAHLKSQIWGDPLKRKDFTAVTLLYKDYIQESRMALVDDTTANIGAVAEDSGPKHGHDWDLTDVQVELRHYANDEYKKLTSPQKLKLKRWREGLPDMPTGTKKTVRNANDPLMKKMIAAMESYNAQNKGKKASGHPKKRKQDRKKAAQPTQAKKRSSGNRNNAALVKQVVAAVREADDDAMTTDADNDEDDDMSNE